VKLEYFPSISIGHFRVYFFIGSGDSWSGFLAENVEVSSSNVSDKLARSSHVSIIPKGGQKYALDSITGRRMKSNTTDGLSLARQWYQTCCESHGISVAKVLEHDRRVCSTWWIRRHDFALAKSLIRIRSTRL
jgi:hypothetical protein